MTPFETATDVRPAGERSFHWDVPDGWQQGRGAWGGLVIAALVRAIEAAETDPGRSVRTVSAQLVAPALVGPHLIEVYEARRGSGITTWRADLLDDQLRQVGSMSAILGSPRTFTDGFDVASMGTSAAPEAPPAASIPVLPLPPPLGPVFAAHLLARPISGIPTMGASARTAGWVRLAEPPPSTAASLLALVDAWWPAALPALTVMRPIATVSFAASLLVDPRTVRADEPLLHHGWVSAAAQGFASEHRQLWTADGRLAVDNLQSIVVIA